MTSITEWLGMSSRTEAPSARETKGQVTFRAASLFAFFVTLSMVLHQGMTEDMRNNYFWKWSPLLLAGLVTLVISMTGSLLRNSKQQRD